MKWPLYYSALNEWWLYLPASCNGGFICLHHAQAIQSPLMIGRLSGTLADKAPPQILLDCQSVGYEVDVPMSTFCKLPVVGEQVVLLTHLIVREDGHFLFGFLTLAERSLFRRLLKVSGIGARIALAVLSSLSVEEFHRAITLEDVTALTRIPGIGRKTAERMLLELRGSLPSPTEVETGGEADRHRNVRANVIHALLALGYNEREAQAAIHPLPTDVSLDEGLRLSLKNLSRL